MTANRTSRRTTLLLWGTMLAVAAGLSIAFWSTHAAASPTCTKTWVGTGSGQWTTPTDWSPSGVPGPSDYGCIPSTVTGTVTVSTGTNDVAGVSALGSGGLAITAGSLELNDSSDASTINALAFSSGTLQVDSGVATTLSGTSTWSGGTLQGSGTTTLPSGATLNLTGGTPELASQTFVNAGTTNQTSGNFCLARAATFSNTGTFKATSNNDEVYDVCSGFYPSTFANASGGTVTSTVSATFSINVPFNNAGTVDVTQGTLETGGGNSLGATDTGAYAVSSGATLNLNDQRTLASSATVTGGTLALTGSTDLTLNGQSFGTVTQSGGTTNGPSTITGSDAWSGGTVTGSGTTSVASGATLNLTGGTPELVDHALTNSGTIDWTSGNFCVTQGAVLTNDKTFTADPGASNEIYPSCIGGGQASSVTNASGATMTTETATADTVDIASGVAFDNAGALTVIQGSFETDGGNVPGITDTGSYTLDAGTFWVLNDQRTFGSAATIDTIGNSTLDIIGSGAVSFGGQSIGNIDQSAGTAYGTFTVTGDYTWSGGTLYGAGTTTLTSTGTLTLDGGTPELGNTHTFANDGTASWNSGNFCLYAGSTFDNQGSFTADSSNGQIYDSCVGGYAAHPLFANLVKGTAPAAGSMTVSVSASAFSYMAVPFNNNGTVAVNDGWFETEGGNSNGGSDAGTYTLASGTIFYVEDQRDFKGASTQISGAGQLNLTSSANVTLKSQKLSNLAMTGGQENGSFTVSGPFAWSGGTLNGTGTLTLLSTSTTTISSSVSIEGPKVTDDGTVNWTTGYLEICDGTVFTNDGVLTATASGYPIYNCGNGDDTAPEFINKKTMTVDVPSNGTLYDYVPFNNTKTVNLTGGSFQLQGGNTPGGDDTGTYALSAGTTLQADDYRILTSAAKITGAGTLSVDSSAVLQLDGQSIGTMAQNGGDIVGPFTVTGTDAWSGGALTDEPGSPTTTTVASTATVTVSGSVELTDGHTLSNSGAIDWTSGYFELCDGAVLDNAKTFTATVVGYQLYNCGGATAPRVLNVHGATFTVNTTSSVYVESTVPFDNAGTVTVTAGTFEIDGPNSAGQSDTGTYNLTGTLLVEGQRTFASGATVTGAGTLAVGGSAQLTLSGQSIVNYTQTAGSVYGPFTVTGNYDWSGGILTDTGAGTTTTVGPLATLDITGSVEVSYGHTLVNDGTIDWTLGNICLGSGGVLDNTATFDAEANGDAIYNCVGGNNTQPELLNGSGATLTHTGTPGTTYIEVPTVNDGTIDIADGILYFNGQDLTESSGGTLQMVIDGTTAGTGFGQLVVSGTATLAGTLDVVTEAGFTPAAASTYELITAGTLLGTFSTVNTTNGFGAGYTISYNPSASPPNVTATAN